MQTETRKQTHFGGKERQSFAGILLISLFAYVRVSSERHNHVTKRGEGKRQETIELE